MLWSPGCRSPGFRGPGCRSPVVVEQVVVVQIVVVQVIVGQAVEVLVVLVEVVVVKALSVDIFEVGIVGVEIVGVEITEPHIPWMQSTNKIKNMLICFLYLKRRRSEKNYSCSIHLWTTTTTTMELLTFKLEQEVSDKIELWYNLLCFIRITLGRHRIDYNNQMIQLTDVFCVLLRYRKASNLWLLNGWFYYPWSN